MNAPFVRWFDEIGLDDVAAVGGKNASLGELHRALSGRVSVPEGFAVTADAYRATLDCADLRSRLRSILRQTPWQNEAAARDASAQLRRLVADARWPAGLEEAIRDNYRRLEAEHGARVPVAVRSSATAEDLPGASFAGQHDTYLNVRGLAAVLRATRLCMASLFTQRAISYRDDKGFSHEAVALSVGIQRMVRADAAASGVIFTVDTESGCANVVLVTGAWGLGEAIVQGIADPDEFLIAKATIEAGGATVLRHRIGAKDRKLVYAAGGRRTRWQSVRPAERRRPCLTDAEIVDLARQAILIESHYSAHAGRPTPMDIEWAKDGPDGDLYIIQARPETAHGATSTAAARYRLDGRGALLLTGQAVGERIASGPVRFVASAADLGRVMPGDVLLAATTAPDWEPAMKRAAAIVTEHGGRTCHAAIIARELGIPAVVGATGACTTLRDGQEVTVNCAVGGVGQVLGGRLPFSCEPVALAPAATLAVQVMVNLGNPDQAFRTAALPVAGVGLARIEFIIANDIRAHPMALLHPDRVASPRERAQLAALVAGRADGAAFFVEKLAEGIGVIAAAFHPRPVVVRLSDFKTDEYAALLGGKAFEFAEANPMLGFRGAARYAHPAYRPAFDLECRALRRVREDMRLTNVIVMVPFCRRLDEASAVLNVMAANGLERGRDGLQIYMMSEIPSNALLVDRFAELFDGFSIGSNDLTQLTLGIDRDSAILAESFSEQDPAVLALIAQTIAGAHRAGRSCGICGQAPSDQPAFLDWLIDRRIDSVSLNPDSVPTVLARLSGRPSRAPMNAAPPAPPGTTRRRDTPVTGRPPRLSASATRTI